MFSVTCVRWHIYIVVALLLCSSMGVLADEQKLRCHYLATQSGQPLGEMQIQHSQRDKTEAGLQESVEISASFQASGWWGRWQQEKRSKQTYTGSRLLSLEQITQEDNRRFMLQGRWQEQHFLLTLAEVKTHAQQEEDQVTGLVSSIALDALGSVGNALALGQAVLGDSKPQAQGVQIPGSDFVSVVDRLPYFAWQQGYRFTESPVALLDTENQRVDAYTLELQGTEPFKVNQHTFPAQVVVAKRSGEETQYWIIESRGYPVLAKVTGRDSDGTYEIKLEQLDWE